MLRIVNTSGGRHQTKILDAETGEDLTNKLNVISCLLELQSDEVVKATLTALVPRVDITASEALIRRVCPYCGQRKEEEEIHGREE